MINSEINTAVMTLILESLRKNKVCQALYIQNFSTAMHDAQLRTLLQILTGSYNTSSSSSSSSSTAATNITSTSSSITTSAYATRRRSSSSITATATAKTPVAVAPSPSTSTNNNNPCNIWCMNLGENYEISNAMWEEFCEALPQTKITHLYLSEHVITVSLKHRIRSAIRENRRKHEMHCSIKNIRVIEKCTNMWWNPINGVRELRPHLAILPNKPSTSSNKPTTSAPLDLYHDPHNVLYWTKDGPGARQQQGGKDQVKHADGSVWKFACPCGEICSSYEHERYHPTGFMYACCRCSIWSHVECVLGKGYVEKEEDLEEMGDVLCRPCENKQRRAMRYGEVGGGEDGKGGQGQSQGQAVVVAKHHSGSNSHSNKQQRISWPPASISSSSHSHNTTKSRGEDDDNEWKFKCKCGEVCSSYENKRYQPKGIIYACSECRVRAHATCMYGEQMTEMDVQRRAKELLCAACQGKNRRERRQSAPVGTIEANTAEQLVAVLARSVARRKRKVNEGVVIGVAENAATTAVIAESEQELVAPIQAEVDTEEAASSLMVDDHNSTEVLLAVGISVEEET